MKKTLVVYHSADFDGIACREVARRFLHKPAGAGVEEYTYQGWNFGDPILNLHGWDEILVMDLPLDLVFGFKFQDRYVEWPDGKGQPLDRVDWSHWTWIDHHKTSIETHPPEIPGFRIDGVAACRLAYAWFLKQAFEEPERVPLPTKENFINRQVTEPIAITLIGEHDVWDHRDPRAMRLQYGLRAYDLEAVWPRLLHLDDSPIELMVLMEAGFYCERYARNIDSSVCEHRTFLLEWEGLRWLCLNSARFNSQSFAARDMRETGHDALLGFCWDGKLWRLSLYHAAHNKQIDLSEIAKKYGGGGHRGACGFTAKTLPLPL